MFRAAVLLISVLPFLKGGAAAQGRPNVVYILADDMGYGDVSCLNPASACPTPNIDRMAREGMVFTDAHVPASLCTPTRYGILTGRYAWRGSLKGGVSRQFDPPLIEQGRFTVGRLFQESGYATACIGKWHLGWEWPLTNGGRFSDSIRAGKTGADDRLRIQRWLDLSKPLAGGPLTRGFDHYFGDDVPNYPPYCFIEDDRVTVMPDRYKPDSMYGHPGLMAEGWRLDSVMPVITRRAVDFIHARAGEARPFFLFFALTSPHVPIAPVGAFRGRSGAGAYGDFVMETDWAVGEVLRALRESGADSNTLVIFTSDNGSPAQDGTGMAGAFNSVLRFGHNPNHPWRGMKTDLWEGGHRVPFIVRWPSAVPAGMRESTTICHTDFAATCAEILHASFPREEAMDSHSILGLLKGEGARQYGRRFTVHHSSEGRFAIRKGDWKLILASNSGGGLLPGPDLSWQGRKVTAQLYNLAGDPGELQNLVFKKPVRARRLRALLDGTLRVQDLP